MILGWTIQNRESDEVAKELMEGIIEDLGDDWTPSTATTGQQ